jgi:ketosteroid isomerase-like protein
MAQTQLEDIAREFLAAYQAKDLQIISNMVAEEVVVRDWNLEVAGKPQALQEFAKNFEKAKFLSIQVLRLYSSDTGVAAEVEIVVNKAERLRVVDVLTFGERLKITSITSYKGL